MTTNAAGTTRQSYDPYHLVDDVVALLEARGLSPERVEVDQPGARVTAASRLLRTLNIDPRRRMEDALSLDGHRGYNRRTHLD